MRPVKRSLAPSLRAFAMALILAAPAWAGSEQVLYQFKTQRDGFRPLSGVLLLHGKIYGATDDGGRSRDGGDGTIYELTETKSGWARKTLHNFTRGRDGGLPITDLTADKAGNLYGSTTEGGSQKACEKLVTNCGTVFRLSRTSAGWKETVIHDFKGKDGALPMGNMVWDDAGNLYGTAASGGKSCGVECGNGTVFKLSPSGKGWEFETIHFFNGADGGGPMSLFRDNAGNLYGSTGGGGAYGYGTVYELSPSGKGWTLTTLYSFTGGADGSGPYGPVLYKNGVIYGTTVDGGASGFYGTVYQLKHSNGAWQESVLYSFMSGDDGSYPCCGVVMDVEGNLYGTTEGDTIFKLTNSGGQWTESTAFSFNGSDGSTPYSRLVWDSQGNLYGTTAYGGNYCGDGGCGTVFKFTP
jgi:uncharacterized repeat protein (TIGR03803 family)